MEKPVTRRFRAKSTIAHLPQEVTERHAKATTSAFLAFRDSTKAVEFMNLHDDALGGRPLDIAGESSGGLALVEAALASRSRPQE